MSVDGLRSCLTSTPCHRASCCALSSVIESIVAEKVQSLEETIHALSTRILCLEQLLLVAPLNHLGQVSAAIEKLLLKESFREPRNLEGHALKLVQVHGESTSAIPLSPVEFYIGESEDEEVFQLPETAVRLLVDLLSEMSHGNSVAVVSLNSEFTTQQAAEYLNVSRPYVVNLLEKGEIPFRKVGSHRRIRIEDLIAYKKVSEGRSQKALDELAVQAQNLGMGY